jgi:acetyl-CoA carboxylase biotin carboxyl carrier protein
MKASEIQELIKFVSKSGISEVEIEDKDFKITIKTPPYRRGKVEEVQVIQTQVPVAMPQQQMPQAVAMPAAAEPAKPVEAPKEETNYITIKSPMIGTFYRKSAPDKPNFVNIGDEVGNDTCVCIIEAMKLFNEIEAEVSGKIVKALVDDGSPVEYDQPLFLVDPS